MFVICVFVVVVDQRSRLKSEVTFGQCYKGRHRRTVQSSGQCRLFECLVLCASAP